MVIPKQTDFELYKIYSVHSVRSNDSVIGLIAASNGGLHFNQLLCCDCLYPVVLEDENLFLISLYKLLEVVLIVPS